MKVKKEVYTIEKDGEESYWHKIGVAFENKDGSFNLKLWALPIDGKLHVRDSKPNENPENSQQSQS